MGVRSPAAAERGAGFSRARLALGVVLITVLGAAAVVGLSRFVEGPHPGSLVFVSESGLVFRDLASGSEEVVLPWGEGWSSPALSRDGSELAYASRDGVSVVDLATGETREIAGEGAPVGFDPDGRLVLVRPGDEGRRPFLRTTTDGPEGLVPEAYRGYEGPVLWASSDRYVARLLDPGGTSGDLVVVDVSGEAPEAEHTVGAAFPLTISPDGREVLYVTGVPGKLMVLDLDERSDRDLGFSGELTVGATSPGGQAAVGGRGTDGEPGIWALRGGGEEPKRLVEAAPSSLAWAFDSSRLFFADEEDLFGVPIPEGGAEDLEGTLTEDRFLEVVP